MNDIISNVGSDLKNSAENYNNKLDEKAQDAIHAFQMNNYDHDISVVSIDATIEYLKERYPRYVAELDEIKITYDISYYDVLTDCNNRFSATNRALSFIQSYNDLVSVQTLLESGSQDLQKILDDIDTALSNLDSLQTYTFIKDLENIKNRYKNEAERFYSFITQQKDNVISLLQIVSDAVNGTTVSSNISALDQIEDIQKAVYLIGVDSEAASIKSDIKKIVTSITTLLQELSEDDVLSADALKPLVSLSGKLNEYGKYLDLSSEIQNFLDNDLAQTYFFSGDKAMTEEEWKTLRDEDFHHFFSMLKKLPDQKYINTESLSQDVMKTYVATDVLHDATMIRRDLLGNLTDFERAILYFKYDYNSMAFFSAFVAVFFDLGAFLTGCFLYGTKHVKWESTNLGKSDDQVVDTIVSENDSNNV